MPPASTIPASATRGVGHLDRLALTRGRTLATLGGVSPADLERVHSPLMSPIIWDLAHIAAFADLWLSRVTGAPMLRPDLVATYDAGETPRAERGALELLDLAGARDYLARVDEALARAVPALDLSAQSPDPLLRDGFLIDLLVEHEEQHRETILQTLQLAAPGTVQVGPPAAWAEAAVDGPTMITVPEGTVAIGAAHGFAYDNERPLHQAQVSAFQIDRTPVSCGAFAEFIADGGYRDARLWSAEGWAWRSAEQAERPGSWLADGTVRRFDRVEPINPEAPVVHVSYWEAEAFAAWRGARLPTELEWEAAARYGAPEGSPTLYPWGDAPPSSEANVDGHAWGTQPARAASAAPSGALGLIGDVWEWTSTPLRGYPGFAAFPYPEYSEVFFEGPYRVLRGGSWATAACCARTSFRNWDFPGRRQIFSGLRCAQDA